MGRLKHITKADRNGSRKKYTHTARRRGWGTLDLDHPITARYFAVFMIAVWSFTFLFALYVLVCNYVFSAAFASEHALQATIVGVAISLLVAYLVLKRYGAAKVARKMSYSRGVGNGAIHVVGLILAFLLATAESLISKALSKLRKD